MISLIPHLKQWWSTSCTSTALLTALGLLTAAKATYALAAFLHLYLQPSRLHRYLHASPTGQPPWALVTGATDGIGKALAHELAAAGFNVVLHGRNAAKLAAAQSELQSAQPSRSFRTLLADASRVPCVSCLESSASSSSSSSSPGTLDIPALAASLSDLHLTVVASNAGGPPHPAYRPLHAVPQADAAANVAVNALFPLHLLAALLPTLARNGPALVLLVGSVADGGLPLMATYASAKRLLTGLARCVALDVAMQEGLGDVEVLALRAARVTGVTYERHPSSLWMPDARAWARAALRRVGCGRVEVLPYWPHAVQQAVADALPAWLRDRAVLAAMAGVRDEERRALEAGRKEA